jgi:hypothetical protein
MPRLIPKRAQPQPPPLVPWEATRAALVVVAKDFTHDGHYFPAGMRVRRDEPLVHEFPRYFKQLEV